MLALTKKTGYGLIAMTHLATLPQDRLASAREIADLFGVPASLLMNVLKQLAAAGYVESVRGVRGGYRLARRPDQINLADMVTALEGPIRLAKCITEQAGADTECTELLMARCPILDPVHRVQRKLNDFLKKLTLAEIVEPTLAAGPPVSPEVSNPDKSGLEPQPGGPRPVPVKQE
jgi:Rrf2 family protein